MTHPRSTREALVVLDEVLDGVDHAERRGIGHGERLALLTAARGVARRVEALVGVLTAEVERAGSSEQVTATHVMADPLRSGVGEGGGGFGLRRP